MKHEGSCILLVQKHYTNKQYIMHINVSKNGHFGAYGIAVGKKAWLDVKKRGNIGYIINDRISL